MQSFVEAKAGALPYEMVIKLYMFERNRKITSYCLGIDLLTQSVPD